MTKMERKTSLKKLISSCFVILQVIAIFHLQTSNVQAFNNSNEKFEHKLHEVAPNYLLFSSFRKQHENVQLDELLKDSNHSHASDAININTANSVWRQMRQNVQEYAKQRTQEARPSINRLLSQANISSTCRKSLNDILDRITQLDQWAVQMYNAFGDFPTTGLFEGSLTSIGSYHQCVDLEPNEWIGQAQYCTFKFQPIVPKRPKYHNILATIENLANFTNKDDMFHHLAKKAQYYYYTKLRLATCMPSKCDKSDFELLGKQVAVNSFLQYSGVSCLQKEEGFNLDGAQIFASSVLILLASISFLGTIVHIFNLRSFLVSEFSTTSSSSSSSLDLSAALNNAESVNHHFDTSNAILRQQQQNLLTSECTIAQHKTSQMLAQPVQHIQIKPKASKISSSGLRERLLYLADLLLHFSIVKNGKKLFDTSTSRRANNNKTSIKDSVSSASSSQSTSSRSDSSSAVNGPTQSSDISCVHGLRFWTISWIIFGHTMQYTEWAGFGRAFQVEQNITSFFLHPLLNATFSVDTFFLISGLLTTYVTWSITNGQYRRFNKFAFLISRYLRLTPQVLLVILLFIVFPLMGEGPYWRGLIQKEAENCKRNWWVNALYLQAFIKQDQICNLVTWWLSIEMFYHFVSIIVIIALLKSTFKGIVTNLAIGGTLTAISCYLHFANHYPPNMLPTLLQRYEIWDSIVLKYFWTPYPHAPSYFVGLLLGFVLYNRSLSNLTKRQVRAGWLIFIICYLSILFGTYSWNNNAPYARITSTVYYNVSQVLWSLATAWAILACAMGHGGWLNSFLSSPIFVPLGRATYMTYLSHMIIVMSYPAKMNLLIEPSYVVFLYIFISNLFLSYALGIFLTLVYESPIVHLQKVLVTKMASKFVADDLKQTNGSTSSKNKIHDNEKSVRVSLYPTQEEEQQQQQHNVSSNPC